MTPSDFAPGASPKRTRPAAVPPFIRELAICEAARSRSTGGLDAGGPRQTACRRTSVGRRAAAIHCWVVVFPSVLSVLVVAKLFQDFNPLREVGALVTHRRQSDSLCGDDAVEDLLVTRHQGANAF